MLKNFMALFLRHPLRAQLKLVGGSGRWLLVGGGWLMVGGWWWMVDGRKLNAVDRKVGRGVSAEPQCRWRGKP
jgi:hypothetical protein